MRVSVYKIKKAIKSEKIREYAYFLYLKSVCKNGCFFDYSPQKLGEFVGISKYSIEKYVRRFINLGWCHKHKGNLIFKGLKHYRKNEFDKYYNIKTTSVKATILELYRVIMKHKQEQFDYLQNFRREISKRNSKISKSELAYIRKNYGHEDNLPETNAKLKISNSKLCVMFKCSTGKASQIVWGMKKRNELEIFGTRKVLIRTNNHRIGDSWLAVKNTHFNGNAVYLTGCNQYKVL